MAGSRSIPSGISLSKRNEGILEIIYRAETQLSANQALDKTSLATERAIEAALAKSSLRDLEVKIRYIPIVMDDEAKARYPARSRLERKNRIFNCCPQLPIEPFLSGGLKDRFQVYVDGLRECGPAMVKLGASGEQVAEFDRLLDEVLATLTES